MGSTESSAPAGRTLAPAERAALEAEMEAIVGGSRLFRSLDVEGRRALLERGVVLGFEPGDVVVREGEPGARMFLVMEGTVRVETRAPHGALELAVLGRGACLGEVAVLTGAPRTATVVACERLVVAAFSDAQIHGLLDAHPAVRAVLETLVEGRARQTLDRLLGG